MLCILKRALRALKWSMGAAVLMGLPLTARADSVGLIISEFMADPTGLDGAQEYVELVATRSIDFSADPYSVVFVNNGSATTSGWVNSSGVVYGFSITTGTVKAGDVVYVGGTGMTPTGTRLREINIPAQPGDRFGNSVNGGVLGNGGSSADAIAVFDEHIDDLTSSTVPIDAIFYGTGVGGAVLNNGAAVYQLPVNDLYNGGKFKTSFYIHANPTEGKPFIATGAYDAVTGSWTTPRTYAVSPATDGVSAIQLRLPEPPVAAVPLPAAVWGGAGLLAFVGLRRVVRQPNRA